MQRKSRSPALTLGLQSLRNKSLLHRLFLELYFASSEDDYAIFFSMHGLTGVEVTRDIPNLTRLNDVTDDISSFLLE